MQTIPLDLGWTTSVRAIGYSWGGARGDGVGERWVGKPRTLLETPSPGISHCTDGHTSRLGIAFSLCLPRVVMDAGRPSSNGRCISPLNSSCLRPTPDSVAFSAASARSLSRWDLGGLPLPLSPIRWPSLGYKVGLVEFFPLFP